MSLPACPRRLLIPLLAAVSGILVSSPAWSQSSERIVYASVLDRSGRPVTDLAARDFTVRENNIEREVLRVSPATEPFDIAVLVDTSQEAESFIADFRRGLREFFQAMANRQEIALIGFGERPTVLVDYTRDTRRLEAGIGRIFAQTGSGAYLMEGIIETSRAFRTRASLRRAVVVITSESQEFSNRDSREVLDELRQSGVVLEAFVVAGNTVVSRAAEAGATRQDLTARAAIADQASRERSIAVTEGPRLTGGRREDLVTSMVLGTRLRDLADELSNQYRLIYARPAALIPPTSIEVRSTRPELRVRATRIPPK